ncbi:VSP_with INR [Hexamita inflata]|uniref:VSP with INR n=1 Tax=Hexamita inflata TaxID=28002 RepID=A0AA86Q3Y6_9EUKA|nr:VSP with INR [Hexamita inflata]
MPSCTCNTANGFSGAGCSCSKKLSVDGSVCKDSCPSTEVSISGASQCSTCPQNTIPNVAQDGCVATTGCAPGFLNVAGTFCVSSCASDSSIDGPSNQCVSCASKDPLTQFSSGQCVCVPGASKATSSASCACNQNFSPASGACSCSKKLSSDGQTCSDKCPAAEVSISGIAQCSTCGSKVSNVDQTACVDKTACSPGYLNQAQTHCVSDCAQDKAAAGSNNQCVSCSSINALSVFGSSSCVCAPNAVGSMPSCTCNTANGFSGAGCSCPKKLSVDGSVCKDSCPSTEVSISGASQCSTCPQNTIPNVAQDGCVATTGCAPGFLNVAGTFCVSSCASNSSIDGPSNQCVSCASKDPLTQFSSGQCVCVPGASKATSSASCACNQNFSPASGACSCSKKLSSDGQTCSDKCPAAEVSISGNAKCSTCGSKVSNVDQTACVDKTACSPGYLNQAQTHCVSDCAQDKAAAGSNNQCVSCSSINALSVFGSSSCVCAPNAVGSMPSCTCNTANGFSGAGCSCSKKLSVDGSVCKDSCPSTEVSISGASQCSTCPQNTIPNVAQDGCVATTGCAPGFLNVAGTFCVSSCASDSSIDGPSNQCVSCASKDPLTQFSSGQCVCVPGASKATSSASCACNQNFSPASGACSCSKKLSSDGQTCSDKCPAAEVSLGNGVQCSVCQSGYVPSEAQTECKQIITTCPQNQFIALNKYQCVSTCEKSFIDGNKCVEKCTGKLTDVSNTICVSQCSSNQEEKSGGCSCVQGYAVSDKYSYGRWNCFFLFTM